MDDIFYITQIKANKLAIVFKWIQRGILWFIKEMRVLIIEYCVVLAPFILIAFLPIPIIVKAIATIILTTLSIKMYSQWRKSHHR